MKERVIEANTMKTPWKDLSPEEQNIKVAKFCGWKRCDTEDECYYRGEPDEDGFYAEHSDLFKGDQLLPDYLNDLNAMHEAEKVLIGAAFYHYYALLGQLCVDEKCAHMASATAAQRAEAFVLTMEAL